GAAEGGDAARAGHAEVGDLEDFLGAEAAAEDVVGLEIAVDHADLVDGDEAAREALDGVRGARRIEARGVGADAVLDALGERGALGPAVHVLDDDPGEIDAAFADGDA